MRKLSRSLSVDKPVTLVINVCPKARSAFCLAVFARVDRREKGLWEMRDIGRDTEADEDGLFVDKLDPGRTDALDEGLIDALAGGRIEDALVGGLSGRLGIDAERERRIALAVI